MPRITQVFISMTLLNTLFNIGFVVSVLFFFTQDGAIKTTHLLHGLLLSMVPLIIFAKAVTESLGRVRPEQILSWAIIFANLFYYLFFWMAWPLYRMIKSVEKILQPPPIASSAAAIEKEILQVVNEGQKEGVFQETEKDMITGIIELKDREVKEVMTPRTDMVSISVDTPINKAIGVSVESGHSRIPVYREDRDDIVGTLYIKDLLRHWDDERRNELKLSDLMRKPYFIPETKYIGCLLRDLQKQKLHMAIVLDEYGGTAGIITVEDIVEEIVGEILDEYDLELLEPVRYIDENIVEVDGRIHVDELNETLQINLPQGVGYDTLGGFLFTSMGHIPVKGESHCYDNVEFIILEAGPRRIDRVKVIKQQSRE